MKQVCVKIYLADLWIIVSVSRFAFSKSTFRIIPWTPKCSVSSWSNGNELVRTDDRRYSQHCVLRTTCTVYKSSRKERTRVSTSRPSWGNFTIAASASATVNWIQASSFGVQSDKWSVCTIFGGPLPSYLYCWPATTTIVHRRHVWASKNLHKSGRSLIHCCWTVSVEQPTSPSTWLWTYFPGVPSVTEDAPVLLRTAATVTVYFCAPYKSPFTLHYITWLLISLWLSGWVGRIASCSRQLTMDRMNSNVERVTSPILSHSLDRRAGTSWTSLWSNGNRRKVSSRPKPFVAIYNERV